MRASAWPSRGGIGVLWLSWLISLSVFVPARTAFAQNPIQWKPKTVSQRLAPGETKTVVVTFTPRQTLTDLVVQRRGIKSVVSASPAQFRVVRKDRKHTVTLTFAVPAGRPEQVVKGRVRLATVKVVKGKRIETPLALSLPIKVTIAGVNPNDRDDDQDGFSENGGDCNDADGAIHPGAGELCNAVDDDCDGTIDDGLGDLSCGVGACARTVAACVKGAPQQCTPLAPNPESCNAVDDDCDAAIDEGLGELSCGIGACTRTIDACTNGQPGQCVPGDPSAEICGNGIDEDCNGSDLSCDTGDTTPPNLSITSPADGSFVLQSRPAIEVSYSDVSGVDTASLAFVANDTALEVECPELTSTGARCTPTSDLPQGAVTLAAQVEDQRGNLATTDVRFTVDSVPVAIDITSPANGLITRDAEIQVLGTAAEGVTSVQVNDVTAALSGAGFSATAPLREGTNMIVALGTQANGKTGTASIEVTRDIVAPIVRIDSPREGQVSPNAKVPVTGLVNDIVDGAIDAVVKVNGIEATVREGTFMVPEVPLVRGPNTIEAVATDAVGNTGRHSIQVTFEQPVGVRLAILGGNGQAAAVKQTLPQPLVAVLQDDLGNPIAGRVITFEVTRNSGALRIDGTSSPERSVQVPSDGSGRASLLFTLGDSAGEGNNRVTATALGVTGEIEFCASALAAPPDKILMSRGDNQRGLVGHPLPLPLEAFVVDRDGNAVRDIPVAFSVVKGSGSLDGQQSLVLTTGADGLARAAFTLGPDPGINNNAVSATFAGNTGAAATFVSSGLTPGNPADTKFSGVVLDNALTPIPGALITVAGTDVSDTTDDQGQFLLENVPVGHIDLRIDPTESPRPETFPPLDFESVTVAGQINFLAQPIRIPALNTEESRIVGGDEDVTLKMKGVPGLELTVFKNSVTCPEGTPDRSPDGKRCRVIISQVHLDKVPRAPPNGIVFTPPAWTLQFEGVEFNPPARITIPNNGLLPGQIIDILQFDHVLYQFINVGKGTVSEDGLVIVSDAGFGITRAGWGGGAPPAPPQTCARSCDDGNRCTDDSCVNGSCVNMKQNTPQTAANMCEGCTNGTPVPKKTAAQCCAEINPADAGGYVLCCNGSKTTCTNPGGLGNNAILVQCAKKHEEEHFKHVDCPAGADVCKTTRPGFKPGQDAGQGECDGSKVEVACLQGANCGNDAACKTLVKDRITQIKQYGNTNKTGCFPP